MARRPNAAWTNSCRRAAANQYTDAKGHKVVRSMSGQGQVYAWSDTKIVVRFDGGAGAGEVGDTPSDLKDLVGG